MAGLFRQGGVNFDDLFDPDIVGDGPSAPNLRAGGTPLKYAALSYGTKRANVGYRVGGSDVSNLWAAKGTAVYVSDGGLPTEIFTDTDVGTGGGNAESFFTYRRNGSVAWGATPGSPGTWSAGTNPGDAYDIQLNQITTNGTGTLTATLDTWQQINADRGVVLRAIIPPGPGDSATVTAARTLRLRIRRRSTGDVLVDRQVVMQASVTRNA